jgi:cytochrome c oxidase subunit III
VLDSHASEAHVAGLAHQFDDIEQQRDACTLGMWLFLSTEILFFGGMFAGYTIYRNAHLAGFVAGSHILNIKLGATNTAVLIGSSLTMALAVHAAQLGKRKVLLTCLALTILLGLVFLGIKYKEYHDKYMEQLIPCESVSCYDVGFKFDPQHAPEAKEAMEWIEKFHAPLNEVELFFCFYFFMTGMHALHMIIGIGIMTVLIIMTRRGRFEHGHYSPVEISGLYWHFVDIVWIFLFPLLYLIGGRY